MSGVMIKRIISYNLVGLNCSYSGCVFMNGGVFLIEYLNVSNLDPFNSRENIFVNITQFSEYDSRTIFV